MCEACRNSANMSSRLPSPIPVIPPAAPPIPVIPTAAKRSGGIFSLSSKHRLPDPSTTPGMTDRYVTTPTAPHPSHSARRTLSMSSRPKRSGRGSWSPASNQLRKIPPFRFASVGMTPYFGDTAPGMTDRYVITTEHPVHVIPPIAHRPCHSARSGVEGSSHFQASTDCQDPSTTLGMTPFFWGVLRSG